MVILRTDHWKVFWGTKKHSSCGIMAKLGFCNVYF